MSGEDDLIFFACVKGRDILCVAIVRFGVDLLEVWQEALFGLTPARVRLLGVDVRVKTVLSGDSSVPERLRLD